MTAQAVDRQASRIPWWRSLGVKIAVAVAGATMVVAVPMGLFLDYAATVDARERLRAEALAQLDMTKSWFQAFDELRYNATVDPLAAPAILAQVGVGQRATLLDDQAMWAVERLSNSELLAVNISANPLFEQRVELQRNLGFAGLTAMLAGAGLGWFAGSRLSLRARRGVAAARRIAAFEPGVIAAQPGGDEVAALTAAIDQLAESLNSRIDGEKAFTSFAAHELRTPVTALVSATELLADDEAGRLVRAQVARLRTLVTDLLEISRLESEGALLLARLDCGEAVREVLASLPEPVRLEVDTSATVLLDRRRLERVLVNLIGNARRHGLDPVTVRVSGARISVDDCGPGFPDWLLGAGPRRFAAAGPAKGVGLGLVIAEGQASALGAKLRLSNRSAVGGDPGGASAELLLAPAVTPAKLAEASSEDVLG